MKILKHRTILDDMLPTQSFTVTEKGETVPLTGIKVDLSRIISPQPRFIYFPQISVSLKDTNDSAFAVILPGQSVTAEHDRV